ncbi:MAG: YaiI/YqxD family protein, partial [Suipraeoptans sp.]
MKVLIDADACPVVKIAENIAKEKDVKVIMLCDSNHVITSDYSEVRTIEAGIDSVDFALVGICDSGDIVVTQDYGVAAMALGKGAKAIHQSGMIYTDENIERLLMERHLSGKARRGKGKHHVKGPRKRTKEDDEAFERAF